MNDLINLASKAETKNVSEVKAGDYVVGWGYVLQINMKEKHPILQSPYVWFISNQFPLQVYCAAIIDKEVQVVVDKETLLALKDKMLSISEEMILESYRIRSQLEDWII
jgi:hypothetical protein